MTQTTNRALKTLLLLLFCLAGVIVVALRGDTRDTFNYVEVFRGLDKFPWDPEQFQQEYFMEWGIGALAGLIRALGMPVQALFIAISALTFLAVAKASTRFGLAPWAAMPFYICTFFLSQQFMQIRQGLAVALSFWAIAYIAQGRRNLHNSGALTVSAVLFHMVSAASILTGFIATFLIPRRRSPQNWLWCALCFCVVYATCKAASSLDLLAATERVSAYIGDEEYGAARSIIDPANIRALLLSLTFIAFRPKEDRPWFFSYMVLLGVYIAHLGIRLGFLDFAILSGRLGSALGFAEIFLLPLMINDLTKNTLYRSLITIAYMMVHFAIALHIQLPFLVEDYLRPLE